MSDWVVLHGGALGDLALTLRVALHLPGVTAGGALQVVSRANPGDLSGCRPSIRRISPEGLGLHWVHAEADDRPPDALAELIAGRRVLNALDDFDSVVHHRLQTLGARAVYSFDPRPRPDTNAHITGQWQSELKRQGLRLPQRIHEPCGKSTLILPDAVRTRSRTLFPHAVRGAYSNPSPSPSSALRPPRPDGAPEMKPNSRRPLLIHPGSGGRAKCWPLSCFLDIARRLRDMSVPVGFLVGPVELERWPPDDVRTIGDEFPLVASPSPDALLALLVGGRALLGNDAGPAHLAALIGTPTVTIFGPTSGTVWRPLSRVARWIQGDPHARPADWGIDPRLLLEQVVSLIKRQTRAQKVRPGSSTA